MTDVSPRIGEVIAASTTDFFAECYELNSPPPFGSLVRTHEGSIAILGVVAEAKTTGLDPSRRPMARGAGELTEEDLHKNNPELQNLLRTEFGALIVGFIQDAEGSCDGAEVNQYLPPRPPHIHGFVYQCTCGEVRSFTSEFDFLRVLVSPQMRGPSDELVAAFLRHAGEAHEGGAEGSRRAFLVSAGKELAKLLSADTGRLNGILRRIRV